MSALSWQIALVRATTVPARVVSNDLDYPLLVFEQIGGQTSAEAAGAFDRPHTTTWRVLCGEGEHPPIAEGVGG
jgi:hypothetical protein